MTLQSHSGERKLLDILIKGTTLPSSVLKGAGDDCALLSLGRGQELLVTCDMMLEDVHFKRDWLSPEEISRKLLVRSLSDIAACGGNPHYYTLSMGIPGSIPDSFIERFREGLRRMDKHCGISLIGGDLSSSPGGLYLDLQMLGSVEKGRFLSRDGALPGDEIFLTGDIGSVLLGLEFLRKGKKAEGGPDYLSKFARPEARIGFGKELATRRAASAAIDVSDGLSTDLHNICLASGVGAVIEEATLPLSPLLDAPPLPLGEDRATFALRSGEEYEILFTAPPGSTDAIGKISEKTGLAVTLIGTVTAKQEKIELKGKKGSPKRLNPTGWDHFRGRK